MRRQRSAVGGSPHGDRAHAEQLARAFDVDERLILRRNGCGRFTFKHDGPELLPDGRILQGLTYELDESGCDVHWLTPNEVVASRYHAFGRAPESDGPLRSLPRSPCSPDSVCTTR